jgi:hypothetical protein
MIRPRDGALHYAHSQSRSRDHHIECSSHEEHAVALVHDVPLLQTTNQPKQEQDISSSDDVHDSISSYNLEGSIASCCDQWVFANKQTSVRIHAMLQFFFFFYFVLCLLLPRPCTIEWIGDDMWNTARFCFTYEVKIVPFLVILIVCIAIMPILT